MHAQEADIQRAISLYNAQQLLPEEDRLCIQRIAETFSIPYMTLHGRIFNTHSDHHTAAKHLQLLTDEEEASLVNYIQRMSLSGHPPPIRTVRELAQIIQKNRHQYNPLTDAPPPPVCRGWIDRFRKRHPEVKTSWSRGLETARVKGSAPEKLAPFYAEFKTLKDTHNYLAKNIYNMDETGHGIGDTQSERVMFVIDRKEGKKKGKVSKGTPPRQEWVTAIECISAAGSSLPPHLIFKSRSKASTEEEEGDKEERQVGKFNSSWLPEDLKSKLDWWWSTSPSGWSNNDIAYDWLLKVFIPLSAPSDPSQHRLLIVDGHGSHMQARFIASCMENNIDLMILPAHTSHITQPLDVGVFGPLKQQLSKRTEKAHRYVQGRVSRADWVSDLYHARLESIKENNILAGWKTTGLHPYNSSRGIPLAPLPATPTKSPVPRLPLSTIASENEEFIRFHGNVLISPVKRKISSLSSDLVAVQAENGLLKEKINHLKGRAKANRGGVTVENLGSHCISTVTILGVVTVVEKERDDKKQKKAASKKVKDASKGARMISDIGSSGTQSLSVVE